MTNFCINIFINKLIFSNKYGSVLSSTTGEPEPDHLLNQTSGPVQGSLRQPEPNCQSGSRFCQSGWKTGPNRTLAALNPPVHCDFDAARWENPFTILVHLNFDARRCGTHSTTPVHLLFDARRWGTPPCLLFSHVSMPGGWGTACPLSAICCLLFEQVMGGFPFSSALCCDPSSI